ncbi:hypothetical protein SCAR479_00410 [Seiridium cardinale]|uniref:Uncharacterized protein n=1 Tax=Seiridium cardinale TaxID=138064 RepID=A0ABR2Y9E9_9PEZI
MHTYQIQVLTHALSVAIEDLFATQQLPPSLPWVFSCCLAAEKHIDVLLYVFIRLPPDLDAALRRIGDGALSHKLQDLAQQPEVDYRVAFTGYVFRRSKVQFPHTGCCLRYAFYGRT